MCPWLVKDGIIAFFLLMESYGIYSVKYTTQMIENICVGFIAFCIKQLMHEKCITGIMNGNGSWVITGNWYRACTSQ